MLTAAARLLDEDPDGWYAGDDCLAHATINYRIRFDAGGPVSVNGFVLGWWRRFVLRRAVWRRSAFLVDRHLARLAADRLAREEAEADRRLTESAGD